MKKGLFNILLVLLPVAFVFPQALDDYIDTVKGDTLVIKDYYDMNDQSNSLYQVLRLDTVDVPAGRVYALKTNGFYPLLNNPTTQRNTIIVGENNTPLVNNDDTESAPPLICGGKSEAGWGNTGTIFFAHNLTVKNCNISPATSGGDLGWNFFDGQADNLKVTFENCLFERTLWVFMSTGRKNFSWHIKDCYFVNMSGKWHRRSGGVFHVFAPQDTLLVENCTHIMASGYLYRLWNYPFNRVIFNHNTFVNCAGVVFQDFGYQSAFSTTNNIFVNCNVQSYCDVLASWDLYEFDPDTLAIGLVNVHDLPDSVEQLDRKYLFENNVVYWDAKLDDIVSTLNENNVNGVNAWTDQMILMNARTQTMFENDNTYPYLKLGDNYTDILPDFRDPQNLFTDQLDNIRTFAIATVDTKSVNVLPTWRIGNTDQENFICADWPIPVDLSYNNSQLLSGATGGFPIGDLNWFPDQKTTWLAQRTAEYTAIEDELHKGSSNINDRHFIQEFELRQNYPNPFNPRTTIQYSVSNSEMVTLKVYDTLGKEVATLVNEYKNANHIYRVEFDGSQLSSGIYIYKLMTNTCKSSKRMLLIK